MNTWQRRTVGILTLGGSGAGFVIVLSQIFNTELGLGVLIILMVALLLYGIGIAAGVMVLEKHKDMNSIAIPFWLIQIPAISSPWISYEFSSGARFIVAISQDSNFHFVWAAGSQFAFHLFQAMPISVGVNLVAVAVVVVLAKYDTAPSDDALPRP